MLQTEWLKLKKFKPFWVVMVLYPVCLFGLLVIFASIYGKASEKHHEIQALTGVTPFTFPEIWTTVTYTASWFHILPCVLILLNICNEFEFRTHRQNLLDGWSRAQFFGAKVLVTLGVTGLTLGWVALATVLLGGLHKSMPTMSGATSLLYFLEQSLVYNFFALAVGFTLRRGLLSLAFFLIYSNFLEKIVFWTASLGIKRLHYYGPLTVANQLLPFPLWKDAVRQAIASDGPNLTALHACAAGYLLFFVGASWWRYHRADL